MIPSYLRKTLLAAPLLAGPVGCTIPAGALPGGAVRESARSAETSSERLMEIGQLLERQGRWEDALRVYAIAANRSRGEPRVVERLELIAAHERRQRGAAPESPAVPPAPRHASAGPTLAGREIASGSAAVSEPEMTSTVREAVGEDAAAIVVQTSQATPVAEQPPLADGAEPPADADLAGAAPRGSLRLERERGANVRQLVARLDDEDPEVRLFASYALWRVHAEVDRIVPVLGELAATQPPAIVSMSVYILGELGPAARDALPSLRAAFYRTEGAAQLHTADAILRISPGDDLARRLLLNSLHAPESRIRRVAAEALAALAPQGDEEVIRELTGALTDDDAAVREQAALTLMAFGPAAQAAVPVLRTAFQDQDDAVRKAAAGALARIQPALARAR